MASREQIDLMGLWLSWIVHDVANPLSALRSGLEMGASGRDLAERGADQLTALTHCLRLIGAAMRDEAQTAPAPQDWFAPLKMLAQGRDVELTVHLTLLSLPSSLASVGLLTAFAMPLIGWTMADGKLIIRQHPDEIYLEASPLSDKRAHHIKEILERQDKHICEPPDVPFYIARLIGQKIAAQVRVELDDHKLILLVKFS